MKKRYVGFSIITILAFLLLLGGQASAYGPHDDGDGQAREHAGKSRNKGFKSGQVKEREPVRRRTKKTKRDDSGLIENALRHAKKKISGNDLKFERSRKSTDRLGFRHIRLTQSYKGIPIVGAEYIVHIDADDNIFATSEHYVPELSRDVTPAFDADRAVAIISEDFLEDISGKVVLPPSLVIYGGELAYGCVFADDSVPYEMHYHINTETGEVLEKYDNIKFGTPSQGNGVPVIDTISGTRLSGEDGTVQVLGNGWKDTTDNLYYLFSFDNLWGLFDTDMGDWANNPSPDWGTSDPAAISAGLNFEITQEYVNNVLGINSFNNQGAFAQANIHYGTNYANAFWDGASFTFGDGNGISIQPLTVLDIVAHEYGHAVTEYTSNLVYSYESGALNESYSDIFGSLLEFYAQPDGRNVYPNSTPGYADWLDGEDSWVAAGALRDMRDPHRFGQPSYYQGSIWYTGSGDNGGVHYNSGVQNHVFYLLAEGGSGTNDGHAYGPIDGLGIEAAGEIALYADMNLLTSSSNHYDARNAWILAAETLGYSADQVQAVSDAWVACGVSPVRLEAPSPMPYAVMGEAYSFQMTVTGAVGAYTCSLAQGNVLPAGLTLDAAQCAVSGVPAVQTAGTYQVGIEVVDSIGMPASRIVSIQVVSPITITPPSPVPVAYLGQPYSAQMTVTGAVEPYACSVGRYTLVEGLSLDSATCEISGVTAIQNTGYRSTEIVVVDAIGMSASRIFTITVRSPITIQLPNPVPFPIVNEPFEMQVTVTGAVGSYTCSASNLPTGLAIDSGTCAISGTPAAFGSRQATIHVVDSLGIPGSLSVLLDVFDQSKLVEAFTTKTAGQSWIDVAADASGNVYAASQTELVKYSGQLDPVWNMPFAGRIHAISVNPEGNIVVTGKDTATGDFLTGMYDPDQNEIWLSSYSGGAALVNSEMTVGANGIIYISGMVMDNPAGLYKFVVFTYDESGAATPFITLDAYHSNSRVDGIVTDPAGNVYLANDYGSNYGNSELVSKYSPEGILLWDTTVWNYYYQHGTGGMAIDANDNIYVGLYGWTGSQYKSDFRSFTSDGALRWKKVFALPGQTYSGDVTVNKDGVLSAVVYFTGGANNFDIATLINRDPSQGVVWGIELYDSGVYDYGTAVAAGPDGGFYVAGRSYSPENGLIIRYDPERTDQDNDGYYSLDTGGTDCNDLDSSIYPGAPEVKADGIDQDCNGYDLTIDIILAEYVAGSAELEIHASSALGQNAGLVVEGYGDMVWSTKKSIWRLGIEPLAIEDVPSMITVYGVEGSESAAVTINED